MEVITSMSLPKPRLASPLSSIDSVSTAYFPCSRANISCHNASNFLGFNCLPRKLRYSASGLSRDFGAVHASGVDTSSSDVVEKWVLEPIGDGDSRHIGVKTARPNAFEIASSEVTIGRAPEKADIAISVPTVSGLHARIEKTEDNLLVTDLDSTNGTFIGEKRLRPGVAAAASPGSIITFGDVHLAIFRVSKFQVVEPSNDSEAKNEV